MHLQLHGWILMQASRIHVSDEVPLFFFVVYRSRFSSLCFQYTAFSAAIAASLDSWSISSAGKHGRKLCYHLFHPSAVSGSAFFVCLYYITAGGTQKVFRSNPKSHSNFIDDFHVTRVTVPGFVVLVGPEWDSQKRGKTAWDISVLSDRTLASCRNHCFHSFCIRSFLISWTARAQGPGVCVQPIEYFR